MGEPFGGQDMAQVDVEWVDADSAVLIKRCNCSDLITALERLANQEAGAARVAETQQSASVASGARERATIIRQAIASLQRLLAEARKPVPGALDYERVRETVPECSNMTDDAVDYLRGRLLIWRLSPDEMTVVVTVANGLLSCSGFGLNQHGSEVLAAIEACRVAVAEPEPQSTEDHLEAAESLLATCRGGIAQWSSVQAIGTEAGAHALVDIATTLRGLREDVQALTAEVREAAETGVRVVTD